MHRIGVIAGDGIGPEVIRQGLRVLQALAERFDIRYELVEYPFGGEHYLKTGQAMADDAFEEIKTLSAVYLGAIGDPRVGRGIIERGIVGRLRWDLDMYINLRPIHLFSEHLCPLKGKGPDDIDMICIRENTEDMYMGIGGFFRKDTPDEVATVEAIFTRKGTERIIRYAFEVARKRPRKKLTMVDKANAVLAHDLWRRVFEAVGKEYPDVTQEAIYVDAAAMWMVKNPEWFDVMVTTNMFGDILTDIGAMLQGGMGIAASGNIHPGRVSMFEPIHGSAPKHAGKNEANPMGAILALQMMLEHLGETAAADALLQAVRGLFQRQVITDVSASSGVPTDEVGRLVVEELSAVHSKP